MQVVITASKTLCLAVTLILVMASDNYAQICQKEGFDIAVQLQKARQDYRYSERLIYEIAAIAGESAIPELRKLVVDTDISSLTRRYANAALAKLGDDVAMSELIMAVDKNGEYGGVVSAIILIANNRAISVLMDYVVKNKDKNLYIDFGDYGVNPMHQIFRGMKELANKRNLPDMPTSYDANEWAQWWGNHKNMDISRPVYESVVNPILQCLAHKVDWGIPDALLEIANYGGEEAAAVLRKFPSPPENDSSGFGSFLGNLNAALAKVGDQQAFDKIVRNLRSRNGYGNPFEKLRYIGDIRAVGALIDALDVTDVTDVANGEIIMKLQRRSILNILAQMVQNAPVGYDAEPTEDNFNIWRKWWETKRDIAVIIPYEYMRR